MGLCRPYDLPPGFEPYAPFTGRLTQNRLQQLGLNPRGIGPHTDAWLRAWTSSQTGTEVAELAAGAGGHHQAQVVAAWFSQSASAHGYRKTAVTDHIRLTEFTKARQVQGTPYRQVLVPLTRGPLFIMLSIAAPAQSAPAAGQLIARLAVTQWSRVPSNMPVTGTGTLSGAGVPDTSRAAGAFIGALIFYLALVSALGYVRKALHRPRWARRSRRPPVPPESFEITDVSAAARRSRLVAALRLTLQIVGLAVAAAGADVLVVSYWYLYLAAGFAIFWAGGRFIHPAGLVRRRNQALLAAPRRAGAVLMLSAGTVMILAGVYELLTWGLSISEPWYGPPLSQHVSVGLGLVALGAISYRRARRLGAVEAHQLMLRDPRPPVLYLRSFGDDRLRLWTATLGRPSFIERFSPRRFDAFEEVLARHLARLGPVIAVNPPGTELPPLGAARATLDPADWHSAIVTWMEQSAQIVFVLPPQHAGPGLLWELEAVSDRRYWHKTLIVVPPVPAKRLQDRWRSFMAACTMPGWFTAPSPAGRPVLVMCCPESRWRAVTANHRSEWSYAAALNAAPGHETPPGPGESPRSTAGPG